jgi:hypothetical protein
MRETILPALLLHGEGAWEDGLSVVVDEALDVCVCTDAIDRVGGRRR